MLSCSYRTGDWREVFRSEVLVGGGEHGAAVTTAAH